MKRPAATPPAVELASYLNCPGGEGESAVYSHIATMEHLPRCATVATVGFYSDLVKGELALQDDLNARMLRAATLELTLRQWRHPSSTKVFGAAIKAEPEDWKRALLRYLLEGGAPDDFDQAHLRLEEVRLLAEEGGVAVSQSTDPARVIYVAEQAQIQGARLEDEPYSLTEGEIRKRVEQFIKQMGYASPQELWQFVTEGGFHRHQQFRDRMRWLRPYIIGQ